MTKLALDERPEEPTGPACDLDLFEQAIEEIDREQAVPTEVRLAAIERRLLELEARVDSLSSI